MNTISNVVRTKKDDIELIKERALIQFPKSRLVIWVNRRSTQSVPGVFHEQIVVQHWENPSIILFSKDNDPRPYAND